MTAAVAVPTEAPYAGAMILKHAAAAATLALAAACASEDRARAPDAGTSDAGAGADADAAGSADAGWSVDLGKLGPPCASPLEDAGGPPSPACSGDERCLLFNGLGFRCAGRDPCAAVTCQPGWRCWELGSFPGMITCMR